MANVRPSRPPEICAIVARSIPGHVIGHGGRLPWRLKSDLAHFRQKTTGRAVIMGRKTFTSLARPLPGRLNIVLSRHPQPRQDGVLWVTGTNEALEQADAYSRARETNEVFIIGGAAVFTAFLDVTSRYWVSEVSTGPIPGDTVFDYEFRAPEWCRVSRVSVGAGENDDYGFTISCFERRKPENRLWPDRSGADRQA
ncbi:MAG: dihydrofolate reductase [Alphaproteobacteria bacterium]|nr:dihydrofolate reductase [Alphaproteobacteria bacterium]